ncbi:phosphoribosylaminoimidazole carboxylase ATPase subunit [Calothrix sp. NIES-4071]|nr:phosphoribosylaminoimidazole carboxylase ATPase subunit [Calothrix sp. NIES-4071]BAZ62300.1 phosphoribosylaminoimidazole carboxylase ATPase subunit [Calothrix sp. NIES-4105]
MKRIGVIGGGQLAWMMDEAASKLGLEVVVQTPSAKDPAVALRHNNGCHKTNSAQYLIEPQQRLFAITETPVKEPINFVQARVDDAVATVQLAKNSDVITFENEFVDLEALSTLAERGVCFRPRLEALAPLLDKYHQRCYLRDIGLPVPAFTSFDVINTTNGAISNLNFPVVLKARRHGYDGQGTYIIKDEHSFRKVISQLENGRFKASNTEFLLEEFVGFKYELAVIAARSIDGEVVIYPVVETQQEQQVCRRVIVPANISPQVTAQIEDIAKTLLSSLDAVGVFGIELFLTQKDSVLINEVAPRTHNSGHFSIDACETSQFEQHLRAVCGLPLGSTALTSPGAVMVNLLGYENSLSDYREKRERIEHLENAHLHWYGKTESRPGRKLGHVTILLDNKSRDAAQLAARTVELIWYPNQN